MNYFQNVWDWLADGSHWTGPEGVPNRLVQHVQICAISLLVAALIAVPIGVVLGHFGRGGFLAINLSNVGRAIPAIAILLMAVLAFGIGDPPEYLTTIGVVSIPAFLALVALAIPPMLTNAYVGVTEVDPDVRDAARGMGMTNAQVLRRVELPLSSPFVMTGIRTSAVAVVATATLLAYVGGGGLGRFIIDGSRISYSDPRVFVGALFVALLSIIVELVLALVQHLIVPRALRPGAGSEAEVRVEDVVLPDDAARVAA
jgi:osmoprotectant transport system permease protein